ncbi:MAG: DUF2461 domain-containing protein [Chloroflexota bacterium]|nr:DUF2461 domain-containing protein [Chloroflexota bacterium]
MATQHSVLSTQHFVGFPPGGYDFFLELQARQSREWFKANKERYQSLWVEPLEALLADLTVRLSDVFPELPSAHRHIFRIQRDTRFSADKSPYKTHVAAHVHVRPHSGPEWGLTPSIYLHFGLEDNVAGVGSWEFGKELLSRFREAVAGEASGGKLQHILESLHQAGSGLASHETLKRVPAPYPQDHPRAELLKLKGLFASVADIPEELMPGPEFLDWLDQRLHQLAPVARWLDEALGSSAASAQPAAGRV